MFYGYVPLYDPQPKVAEESVAVPVCENRGRSCDQLIDLPAWNYKACETEMGQ